MPKKALSRKKTRAARTTTSPRSTSNRSTSTRKRTAPSTSAQSSLRRPLQAMPAFVRRALRERGLLASYRQRPAYQRNDYLGWIGRAKQEATQQKRLAQMLGELAAGDRYMNMAWRPRSAA